MNNIKCPERAAVERRYFGVEFPSGPQSSPGFFILNKAKSIPNSIIAWSLKNNRVKELRLLYYFKRHGLGHFHKSEVNEIFAASPVKVLVTFEKQLKKLVEMKWVYYSSTTGFYNIKSWRRVMASIESGMIENGRVYINDDIKCVRRFRALIFSGFVMRRIHSVKYYMRRIASEAARKKSRVFLAQRDNELTRRFGIGMEKIAKELGFTRQYMSRLKSEASKYGFISCSAMYVHDPMWGNRRICDQIQGKNLFLKSVAQRQSLMLTFTVADYKRVKGK